METTFNCSTCNHKEKSRSNYPCRSCVYNEFAPDATLHYWEPRKDTIKMKDFTQKEAAKIRRYAEWLEQAVSGQTVDPRK